MKKNGLTCIVLLLLLMLAGCKGATESVTRSSSQSAGQTATSTSVQPTVSKTKVPTVFIHGYSGTINSFKSMLNRMEATGNLTQEMLIEVAADGELNPTGALSGEANNPTVQVIFESNKDNEWNQTEWIRNVLAYLKATYEVDTVNLVGHSMGGVSSFRYLFTYPGESDLPEVAKFVAIGSPFNEFIELDDSVQDILTNGPSAWSTRYSEYTTASVQVPVAVEVLLVAGQLSDTDWSDGTVPLNSALAIYSLLTNQGNQVIEEIMVGEAASHSGLHENTEVDQLVAEFLWPAE